MKVAKERGEGDKMVDYQIVKKCGLCRKQMVVGKSERSKRFCDKCKERIDKSED